MRGIGGFSWAAMVFLVVVCSFSPEVRVGVGDLCTEEARRAGGETGVAHGELPLF